MKSCLAIHIEPSTVVVRQTTMPAYNLISLSKTDNKPKSTNFRRCSTTLLAITRQNGFQLITPVNRLSVERARYTKFTTFPRHHHGVVVDFSSSLIYSLLSVKLSVKNSNGVLKNGSWSWNFYNLLPRRCYVVYLPFRTKLIYRSHRTSVFYLIFTKLTAYDRYSGVLSSLEL